MIPLVFVAGYSNAGKTTVAERLVRSLKNRGYRVAVIKHAPHGYVSNPQGKDSWRYFEARADSVIVVGPDTYSLHRRCRQKPALNDVLKEAGNVDIIIVEGFKSAPGPKIEVYRKDNNQARLPENSNVVAIVSDISLKEGVPCFSFEQAEELAEFVVAKFLSERGEV